MELIEELVDRLQREVNDDIVLGDSEVVLRNSIPESVDCIIADPPFGVNYDKSGDVKSSWGNNMYQDKPEEIMEMCRKVFKEMYRVLKNNRHAYVWFATKWYETIKKSLEDAGFYVDGIPLIWNKISPGAPSCKPYHFTSSYEPCFFCWKGENPILLNFYYPNILTFPRVPAFYKIHPTEKPVAMIKKLIEISTQPGELVLDPFAGSGSTLIAAYECNRKAWGIEKKKNFYINIAIRIKKFKGNNEKKT